MNNVPFVHILRGLFDWGWGGSCDSCGCDVTLTVTSVTETPSGVFVGQVNFHLVQTIGTVSPVSPNPSEARQIQRLFFCISWMKWMWFSCDKLHNVLHIITIFVLLASCIMHPNLSKVAQNHRTFKLWTRRIFKIPKMTRKATQEAPAPDLRNLRSHWVYLRKKSRISKWIGWWQTLSCLGQGQNHEFVTILVVKLSASS